jgi:hypothetical protein
VDEPTGDIFVTVAPPDIDDEYPDPQERLVAKFDQSRDTERQSQFMFYESQNGLYAAMQKLKIYNWIP